MTRPALTVDQVAAPISEKDLCALHPWIGASRLRAAATEGKVPYLAGQRRSRWYGPAEIASVIAFFRTEPTCPAPAKPRYLSLVDSGSPASRDAMDSGVSGMTPELRESAASALAAAI